MVQEVGTNGVRSRVPLEVKPVSGFPVSKATESTAGSGSVEGSESEEFGWDSELDEDECGYGIRRSDKFEEWDKRSKSGEDGCYALPARGDDVGGTYLLNQLAASST